MKAFPFASGLAATALLAGCAAPRPPAPAARATVPPPQVVVPAPAPAAVPAAPAPAPVAAPPVLPYGPAVAARFPAPAERYDTPGLRRGGFTSNAELAAALRGIADAPRTGLAPMASVLEIGRSAGGEPLLALSLSRDAQPKPSVLLVGQMQGDEPAGAEALLVLAGEFAAGRLRDVLSQVDVVIVPRLGVDAAAAGPPAASGGIDLDHDMLRLDTPEAQALAGLMRERDPSVVVDVREYPAVGDAVERLGGLPRADLLFEYATVANGSPLVARAADEWFRRPAVDALTRAGSASDWYHDIVAEPLERPDSLRNAAGLRNAVSLLVASRGTGLGFFDAQRRVHAQLTALHSVLASAAARAGDVARVRRFARDETAAKACQGDLVVEAVPIRVERRMVLLDPQTGADRTLTIEADSPLELAPKRLRARPCGYWLAPGAAEAARRLQLQGVQVDTLAQASSALGERYRERTRADGALGPPAFDAVGTLIDMPAGSYYVPMTQPLANLAAAMLEPDTPSSVAGSRPPLVAIGDLGRLRARPDRSGGTGVKPTTP